jgi:hypothetical protein
MISYLLRQCYYKQRTLASFVFWIEDKGIAGRDLQTPLYAQAKPIHGLSAIQKLRHETETRTESLHPPRDSRFSEMPKDFEKATGKSGAPVVRV